MDAYGFDDAVGRVGLVRKSAVGGGSGSGGGGSAPGGASASPAAPASTAARFQPKAVARKEDAGAGAAASSVPGVVAASDTSARDQAYAGRAAHRGREGSSARGGGRGGGRGGRGGGGAAPQWGRAGPAASATVASVVAPGAAVEGAAAEGDVKAGIAAGAAVPPAVTRIANPTKRTHSAHSNVLYDPMYNYEAAVPQMTDAQLMDVEAREAFVDAEAEGDGGVETAPPEEEAEDWPPRIQSANRPITLPLRGDRSTVEHVEAEMTADDYCNIFSGAGTLGAARKRRAGGGVYASGSVAAAAGYGLTAAAVAVDAEPIQCAHQLVDVPTFGAYLAAKAEAARGTEMEAEAFDQLPPLVDTKLMHFIFPSTLPFASPSSSNAAAAAAKRSPSSAAGTPTLGSATAGADGADDVDDVLADPSKYIRDRLERVPSGTVGKLRFHKSGAVTMKFGELVFEVTASVARSMYEHYAAVMPQDDVPVNVEVHAPGSKLPPGVRRITPQMAYAHYLELGPVGHTFTVVPNVDGMLSGLNTQAAPVPDADVYARLAAALYPPVRGAHGDSSDVEMAAA